jgi:hypothetical protein
MSSSEEAAVSRNNREKSRRFKSSVLAERLELRALLCGLPHSELIAPPVFDWKLERRVAAENRSAGGDAVSIIWSNRGAASDGFASTFGTAANAGRAVVDAVLAQWSRIITNWNRSDGTTTLQVNISMTGFGFGAAGGPDAAPADNKPRTGSITLGAGSNDGIANNSNGWFFDPTPMDNAEFLGTINHAYNASSSSASGSDFFSVVNNELAHVLGLISDKNNAGGGYENYPLENFTTATGIRDNAEGGGSFGFFYTFNGPTIQHLMTGYNSGDGTSASWGNVVHTSGGTGNINFGGTNWRGTDDEGNAIYNGSERTIPSFVMAHILADAYGYSIIDPATFATMHTVLNQSTGQLTIRGGQSATSSDLIVIDVSGSDLVVTVDVGDDVAGSGALPGAGNLPAYVTRVPLSSITSIVMNGGGARDYLRIERTGGKPVTVNGGDGDDFIDFSIYGRNLDTTGSGSIYIQGGNGADYTYVYDDNNTVADTFTITSSRFDRPFWAGFSYAADIEGLNLFTGTAANVVNIESTYPGQPITTFSIGGNDTVNIGNTSNGMQSIRADVQVQNDPSFTDINLLNGPDATDHTWAVDISGAFGYITGIAPANIFWDNTDINAVNLTTGSGVDTGYINRLSETLNIGNATSNPGGIYDQITIGNSAAGGMSSITQGRAGGLTIDNNPSYTRVILDDTGDTVARNATLQVVSSYNQLTGMAPAVIRFDDTDTREATLISGSGADVINILSYGAQGSGLTLNSWSGGDAVNIGDATTGLQSIGAPIIVRNTPSFSSLNLINNADTIARVITVDYSIVTDLESISGISAAPIYWDPGDISSSLGVVVTTGSARDSISVLANERMLSFSTAGAAGEQLTVGPDLDRINADIYTRNPPSFTAVTVNDTAFSGGRAITMDTATVGTEVFSRVSGFGASLYFKAGDTSGPISLNTGGGNDVINVTASSNTLAINAGNGDDHVNIGSDVALNMDPVNADVSIDGGVGSDYIHFRDQNYGATGGNMNVNSTNVTTNHSATVNYANVELLDFYLSNAGSTLNVLNATTPVYATGGTSHDTFNIYNNPVYTLLSASGGRDDIAVDVLDSGAGGVVYLNGATHDLGSLYLGNGAYTQLYGATDPTLRVTSLNMAGGKLDLADGSLIVNYAGATPMTSIRNALLSGRNGGTWNGSGIISSSIAAGYALGFAEATQIRTSFPATFGAFADVDNTSVVVRYTLLGDTNLDKAVNFDDLLRLAQSYDPSTPGRVWSQGDFDYSGIVSFDDLLALAQQYGNTFSRDLSRVGPLSKTLTTRSRRTLEDAALM